MVFLYIQKAQFLTKIVLEKPLAIDQTAERKS